MTAVDASSYERSPAVGRAAPEPAPRARAHMLAAAAIVLGVFVLSNTPTPLYTRWSSPGSAIR